RVPFARRRAGREWGEYEPCWGRRSESTHHRSHVDLKQQSPLNKVHPNVTSGEIVRVSRVSPFRPQGGLPEESLTAAYTTPGLMKMKSSLGRAGCRRWASRHRSQGARVAHRPRQRRRMRTTPPTPQASRAAANVDGSGTLGIGAFETMTLRLPW